MNTYVFLLNWVMNLGFICLFCLTISDPLQAQNVQRPDKSELPASNLRVIDNSSNFDDEALLDGSEMDLDDESVKFEEESTDSKLETRGFWDSLTGKIPRGRLTLRHEASYQFGSPEQIVTNRSSLRLEWNTFFASHFAILLDGKITAFAANDHYSEAKEEDYRLEGEVREGYLQVSFGIMNIKAGKQVIVWGEADSAVITDVISPRNRSEFMFTTLEDSRIGQNLLLWDIYSKLGTFTLIVNPDPQLDTFPEKGMATYIESFDPERFQIEEKSPDNDGAEYGFRWKISSGKSDISLMAGNLVENQPKYEFIEITSQNKVRLQERSSRFQLIGLTGNFSKGNFLWQGELAYKTDRTFQSNNLFKDKGILHKNTLDAALGLEYSPGGAYTLKFELSNQWIEGWEKTIQPIEENETSLFILWKKKFLHETLNLQYTGSYQFQYQYGIHQLLGEFDITDAFQAALSVAIFEFQKEDTTQWPLRDADRITVSAKWNF